MFQSPPTSYAKKTIALPHLELQILHVRSHQIGGNGLHRLRDTAIFLQEKGELVVVGLELLLLQQDHLGRFRNLHSTWAAAMAIGLCHRFPFNDFNGVQGSSTID